MCSDLSRFEFILKMILDIESYLDRYDGSITVMMKDNMAYNATLLSLIQIGEALNKIKNSYDILDSSDIKGAYSVRNFIAHDYDGVNKAIIEDIIRYRIPELKQKIKNIINCKEEAKKC